MKVPKGWTANRTLAATQELLWLLGLLSEEPKRKGQKDKGKGKSPPPPQRQSTKPDSSDPTKNWQPFTRLRQIGGETIMDEWVSPTRKEIKWEPALVQKVTDRPLYWLPQYIETPALRKPKTAKGVGVTDAGSVLMAPWRLYTDQRVFRMNRARRSGSLLIDASGSMGLSREAVEQIVKAIPAAVIGMYSSDVVNLGVLRVLAKWGKLVVDPKAYKSIGTGNGIDGPALRWLAHQPRPRIWISDGVVTGVGDRQAQCLYSDVADICDRHRILRVRYLHEARKLL